MPPEGVVPHPADEPRPVTEPRQADAGIGLRARDVEPEPGCAVQPDRPFREEHGHAFTESDDVCLHERTKLP